MWQGWERPDLGAHLQADLQGAQGLPGKCHLRCRHHLHRIHQAQNHHYHRCGLHAQAPRVHLLWIWGLSCQADTLKALKALFRAPKSKNKKYK